MAEPLRTFKPEPVIPDTESDLGAAAPPLGHRVLRRLAAALTYRDFRILWLGAFVSTCGTWMQKVAQSWLIFTLSGSAFYLGLDNFLGEVPIMLFALIGGVIADRHDRRYVLMGSQYVQMTCAFTLAALVYLDVVQIWHILALSFVIGLAQAFGGPANQSLIPSLVKKRDLPNAIALSSIQFNLTRAIGPALAGVVVALWGTAAAFGINGLSFLVVIVALMSLHVRHVAPTTRQRWIEELRGGLSFVRHRQALLALTILIFTVTFLTIPLHVLLPVIAQDVFQGGVGSYSRMLAASGAGAVVGALGVAWMGRFGHMGLTALLVQIVLGFLVLGVSLSRVLWVSFVLLFLCGACLMIIVSLITTLVQLIAPNELRGRVMSIHMVALRGGMPLGSLVAGYIASVASAPLVLSINGGLLALVGVYFLVAKPEIRTV